MYVCMYVFVCEHQQKCINAYKTLVYVCMYRMYVNFEFKLTSFARPLKESMYV